MVAGPDPNDVLDAARSGDRGALARLLTAVERGGVDARSIGKAAYERAGSAYTVGITGAPGAGKSTLTSAVLAAARSVGDRLAVLAIDPSSPFTGGAILGDRVRMGEHALDDGVFIRSMATRGHLGGLALATPEAIRVLDAAGFPWVLVETVGVGQVEVEVAGAADTTVVVVNPGWGDAVQANKAGLMEIADVFVVNKADRDGAAQTRHDIESMLDLTKGHAPAGSGAGAARSGRASAIAGPAVEAGPGAADAGPGAGGAWRPPVVLTTGTTGDGAEDLWSAIADHRRHLESTGDLVRRREARLRDELALVVEQRLRARAELLLDAADRGSIESAMTAGRLDPWSAADLVLGDTPAPAPANPPAT